MRKPIIIVGAGGFGREVAQLITDINKVSDSWEILGFVDDDPSKGDLCFMGLRRIGEIETLKKYRGASLVLAVGNPRTKRKILEKIMAFGGNYDFPPLIHPSAQVGETAEIGSGAIIAWNSVVTVSCRVGNFSLVYINNSVPHDSLVGDFATLYVGVILGGASQVGEGAMLGSGSIILPGKKVGTGSVVGAGAVVVDDIPPNSVAVGVPARVIKEVEEKW